VERLEVWTRQLYLQLPPLSEEFHALARQLPGRDEAPLETAASIETFLETEYRYSLRTPSQRRSDPVEDFLLDARAGHCEFFATAMIMLTRAHGIPSRLVTGFSQGERNEYGDFEVVRKSDAHAWVEVFDERRGWVAFDPTPSAPASARSRTFDVFLKRIDSIRLLWDMYVITFDYERQRDVLMRLGNGLRALRVPTTAVLTRAKRWAPLLVALGVVSILVILLGRTRRGRRWRFHFKLPWFLRRGRLYDRPEAAVRFYENLLRRLERSGFSKPPGMTPAEFAGSMEERLPGLTELTRLYYRVRFGGAVLPRHERTRVDRLVTAIQVSAISMGELVRGRPSEQALDNS
jgi:predicted nucleic acid-binding protein